MNRFLEFYENGSAYLERLYTEYEAARQELILHGDGRELLRKKRIEKLQTQLQKILEYREEINKYRKKAEQHLESKNMLSVTPRELNFNRLRNWSMMIHPESTDDPYARRVYMQTVCNLVFLDQKEKEFQSELERLENENDAGDVIQKEPLYHRMREIAEKERRYLRGEECARLVACMQEIRDAADAFGLPEPEDAAEEDTETPAEGDTEGSAEESAEAPTEEPVGESTEVPAEEDTEEPAEEDTEESAEEDTEESAEEDTEESAEEDTETTAEGDTEESAEKDTEVPAEERAEVPAEEEPQAPAVEPQPEGGKPVAVSEIVYQKYPYLIIDECKLLATDVFGAFYDMEESCLLLPELPEKREEEESAMTPAEEEAPPAEEEAPPAEEEALAEEEAPPAEEEAPPAEEEAPPAEDEAPAEEETPPTEEAPPAEEETPPAEEEAPSAGEETPPAEEIAPKGKKRRRTRTKK